MTKTEWIVSIDDDLKDFEELFVGNVRDGDVLIRCKDCIFHQGKDCVAWDDGTVAVETEDDGYCYLAERKEE